MSNVGPNPLPPDAILFTRAGHISELSFDRMDTGELTTEEVSSIENHVASCEACRTMRRQLRAFDESVSIAPPLPVRRTSTADHPPHPLRRGTVRSRTAAPRRRRSLWAAGTFVAAAAAVALVVWVAPDAPIVDDGIRIKGAPLSLEVFVEREGEVLGLDGGDNVHPGERLGFRVQSKRAGHIMIVGLDSSESPYLCYPQDRGGEAIPTEAMDKAMTLDQAVRLDNVLGDERLLLIHCERPFAFEDIEDSLPTVPSGCTHKELRVAKTRP